MMNRLQYETSPYLLQHKNNPVDWYPWGDEALNKSKTENKAILLSVGYSACHWCHVMAHESFEHDPTAQMMNDMFVNIKVDREERPDVDAIYMRAIQALSGQGGWPMTVFLLPDGRPFYGGTYFPLEPRFGMPSFRDVLANVHDAFVNRHDEVEAAANNLTGALSQNVLGISSGYNGLNTDLITTAAIEMLREFDKFHGGFGKAPKFPQPMNLEFILRYYLHTKEEFFLNAVTHTLRKMARGGIYDQVGGGFARYSVDAVWLVPHFEKMLYDNAQLSRLYLHAWQVTGDDFFKKIAVELYDYILREMTAADGGFYSATDADSEGEEGKFFVWSVDELTEILGENAAVAIAYWDVTKDGNFEGKNILSVPFEDHIVAKNLGMSVESMREKISMIKGKLYNARAKRVSPGLDDKILTSWNGLMLASLAEAARVLARHDYEKAAIRCGDFILRELIVDNNRVLRTQKNGQSKLNGYLEDYSHLIDGLLELYQTTFDERWFTVARSLADRTIDKFQAEDGGFYDTSDDHEALVIRPRSIQDNAIPSGNSVIAKQLLLLAAYTGDSRYQHAAEKTLVLLEEIMSQYPQGFGEALNAVDMLVNSITEVAIVGDRQAETTRALLKTLTDNYYPNIITALSDNDVTGENTIPLLSNRTRQNEQSAAYVCHNFACQMPVTMPDDLQKLLE
jgi:uncharacterized protein